MQILQSRTDEACVCVNVDYKTNTKIKKNQYLQLIDADDAELVFRLDSFHFEA